MAGMDWFRWHHGSVTDPKFQLVAKKSGASVAEVVAMWAFALEEASLADDRGSILGLDVESVECLLGINDGKGSLILAAMEVRGLIKDGRIASWDKRQPSREREDDTAAERKRKQREREAMSRQVQPEDNNVTPSHTKSHQETPREDKSREEETKPSVATATGDTSPKIVDPNEIIFGYGVPLLVSAGNADKAARSFLGGLRKQHGDTAVIDKLRECIKANPLQPLEWLAAALPPPSCGKPSLVRVPPPDNFETRDYGMRAKL